MKTRCLVFVLLIAVVPSLQASIFDETRVTETDFQFTVGEAPLEVLVQGISLRAVRDEIRIPGAGPDGADRVTYVTYRAYHLELAYKLKFVDQRDFAEVEFFRGNDRLHSISISDPGRQIKTTAGQRYASNYLAISLEGVPLTMLDSVDRVNFIKSN